jgi:copper chaperone CopZ
MQCCEKEKSKNKALKSGLISGIISHIGCIAFILFSMLGVAGAGLFFKPLLLNPHFFYILVGISLIFSTVSALLYLKVKKVLGLCKCENRTELKVSADGIIKEWKYLTTLYGTTILVNLLLFMVIFPLAANLSSASPSLQNYSTSELSQITLQVDIPCPGHAPLITDELKSIDGVVDVKFRFSNLFDVSFDPTRTSEEQILSPEVFKTYKATIIESTNQQINTQPSGSCCGNTRCGCGGRQ